RSRRSTKIGNRGVQEHLNAIRIHNWEMGGTICGIVGLKGCGTTHLMLRLGHQTFYRNTKTNKIEPDTGIWSGRERGYVSWTVEMGGPKGGGKTILCLRQSHQIL